MDFLGTDRACVGIKREAREECPGPFKKLAKEISVRSLPEIKPRMNRQEMPFIAFIDDEISELYRANCHRDAYDGPRAPDTGMDSSAQENLNTESFPLQTLSTGSNPPGSAQRNGPAQKFQFLEHSGQVLRNPAASRSGSSPLTIFYNGSVSVYDVSADKAQVIIWLAENGFGNSRPQMSPRDSHYRTTTSSSSSGQPICSRNKAFSMISGARQLPISNNKPSDLNSFQTVPCLHAGSDLPIARKHSLRRFLEKRKERRGFRLHSVTGGEVSTSSAPVGCGRQYS